MSGLLTGVRVLDLTWVLSGPFATMILADMGADVIKIERPPGGDPARVNAPVVEGLSAYFASLNRGKRSLGLNLGSPEGKALFLDLVARADVVVENFKAGTLDRLGLGYAALAERNPRIIVASISGFGQTGPYRDRPAYDVIVQAMAGTMSINGTPESGPLRVGFSVGDIAAGMYTAMGVLGALYEREVSGRGQALDIAMLDCQMSLLENAFSRYFTTGELPRPIGSRHPVKTPFQTFPTADGHVALACSSEEDWVSLCRAVERPDLARDPRFATNDLRTANHAQLEAELNAVFGARTTAEWSDALVRCNVPAGPVQNIADMAADPHTQARGMVVELEGRGSRPLRFVNHPVRYSRSAAGVAGLPPGVGEHSGEVLTEVLGLAEAEITALRKRGILA